MSFQMTHMEIAYRVADRYNLRKGIAEFILGSVAPDSVHFREDFAIEQKVHSHLFEECGPWGDTQDYDRWLYNIDEFWKLKGFNEKDINKKMFLLGICVHCKTDYYNDTIIWRGLQRKHIPPMTLEKFKEEYYPEARLIDKWLYQNSKYTKEICKLLETSRVYDFEDYIFAGDQEALKKHLLNVQYNVPAVDPEGYKYYTKEKILDFVDKVSEEISNWGLVSDILNKENGLCS
ncbi:MAG: zinc dependent phospholipase C family protein [Butyrivibrio sp.]|nr:zinc dependent phospholipase C family protein [Butyrivibrio sp.]